MDHFSPLRQRDRYLSRGEVSRRWGISRAEVIRLAEKWGWSIRRDNSTAWRDQYRESNVLRTMEAEGIPELRD